MPIGVFDSGYGGLTILREIKRRLPQYDYLYLGDNARAPYGNRSFDIVYDFTLQAVKALFDNGCHLVILACNTASAKALRSIQQNDLPKIDPQRRVLGVIRPTVEVLPSETSSGHVGLIATPGTVNSHSYRMELEKISPQIAITEYACPMFVPLVENNEADGPGADYFVKKYIDGIMGEDPLIDTLLLGCTHYPLLIDKIRRYLDPKVKILPQGGLVADSLADYLRRHPEIDALCSKNSTVKYLTTESPEKFDVMASNFMSEPVSSQRITLPYVTEDKSSEDIAKPEVTEEKSLDELRDMLPGEAIPHLDKYIARHPDSDGALTIRGMKHWALGNRSSAINDYLAAIRLNPDSNAVQALQTANEILNFFNKDLLNP